MRKDGLEVVKFAIEFFVFSFVWGKCGERKQKNPRRKHSTRVLGTRSRGRTGTSFRTLVFETNASTDSAIRA